MTLYVYKVIREFPDGSRGKRAKSLYRFEPDLKLGGGCILTIDYPFPNVT